MSRLLSSKVIQWGLANNLSYSTSVIRLSTRSPRCILGSYQMASSKGKRKLAEVDLGSLGEDSQTSTPSDTKRTSRALASTNDHASRRSISPPRPFKPKTVPQASSSIESSGPIRRIESPVKLTKVEGLPDAVNVDTVSLEDILGNPLVKECWAFNYLIDVEFLLSKFDSDIRDQVQLTVVHGFWKHEDRNRAILKEAVAKYPNVKEVAAYMPEMFGTHHSKMLILTRHDELAQVVILTANFIEQDWRMAQGAWISPLLPFLTEKDNPKGTDRIGTGSKFKFDLISYLKTYKDRLQKLVAVVEKYDFQEIRAALVASVPYGNSRQSEIANTSRTNWGWPGLKHVLSQISCAESIPEVTIQISSVATLGVKDTWLQKSLLTTLSTCQRSLPNIQAKFSIIFPTAEEIRRSISGYECGSSIHMKTQSDQNQKQLQYIRPMLHQWSGDTNPDYTPASNVRRAGRRRAGPHIKTYIRFGGPEMRSIDWALLTSANLSTQAWGASANKDGEVRISSYEIGVIVWPALFKDHPSEQIEMIPVFQKDQPEQTPSHKSQIGYRMPYDLPLVPYSKTDEPWCATKPDNKPDWMGRAWPGY